MTELVVHGMRRSTDRVHLLARGEQNIPDITSLVPAEFGGPAAEEQRRTATISCIIPAYNEESTIADVLTSLLAQTRPPDAIHVIINNTDDDTPEIAAQFAGEHFRVVKGEAYHTVVHVHDYESCRAYAALTARDGSFRRLTGSIKRLT